MTYRVIHRGPTRPVPKEFTCPVHGHFVAEADRDADSAPCTHAPVSYSVGPVDGAEGPRQYFTDRCGIDSPWNPRKVPAIRMRRVEAVRGPSEKAEHKGWLDSSNLEEGQDPDEFAADREKVHEELRKELVIEMARSD